MTISAEIFEKLGLFYLGASTEDAEEPLLVDSRDLLTHAICVGMTGSGKTGLCVDLLEEAAMDEVPAIVIDPKGDLGNLLLSFPELDAASFRPWVDAEQARRKGMSVDEFADAEAKKWREGLASWGQGGDRIRDMREKVDFSIYTPGSTAGRQVSVLDSFAAPPDNIRHDAELLADRVEGTVTSLLGLIGEDADPLSSPVHILLSNILSHAWSRGRDLSLRELIGEIQRPPFDTIGVMALDDVFDAKKRAALAMRINNLVASPAFSAWLDGEPMDIDAFLYTDEGKPRVSVFSIAHLDDRERMFFVSLLLDRVVGWMRTQSGTSSLRALVYMDEIFGYVPPVAKPPSKKPILTMLKQARAFGVGLVLATQNPADIDYKALSNAGAWFVGRLQTEQDINRVIDGLESAAERAGSPLAADLAATIGNLEGREFVLNNVHEPGPRLFKTRWAMSYLRGPMTRADIERLTQAAEGRKSRAEPAIDANEVSVNSEQSEQNTAAGRSKSEQNTAAGRSKSEQNTADGRQARPAPLDGLDEHFMQVASPRPSGAALLWRPMLYGSGRVHFDDHHRGIDQGRDVALICGLQDGAAVPDWSQAHHVDFGPDSFVEHPEQEDGEFVPWPKELRDKHGDWEDALDEYLYRNERLQIWSCDALDLEGEPGESEKAFRIRLRDALHEARDAALDEVRSDYETKFERLRDRIWKAEKKLEKEEADVSAAGMDAAVDLGGAFLSSLLGRRRSFGGRVSRGVSKQMKERRDIDEAEEALMREQDKFAETQDELKAELARVGAEYSPENVEVTTVDITPDRNDIDVRFFGIVWVPYWEVGGERMRAV